MLLHQIRVGNRRDAVVNRHNLSGLREGSGFKIAMRGFANGDHVATSARGKPVLDLATPIEGRRYQAMAGTDDSRSTKFRGKRSRDGCGGVVTVHGMRPDVAKVAKRPGAKHGCAGRAKQIHRDSFGGELVSEWPQS